MRPPRLFCSYDANGNTLTDAQSRSFTWDFENRLVSATNPGVGTTTFKYDPFGRRIQKSGPLGTTNYLYDGDNLAEELDPSGSVLARYTQTLLIDDPLAEVRSGTTTYYEADGLNSITSLTSATSTIAGTYVYDTFGNLLASTGSLTNSFRYTGREFDSETGIYQYRARYYEPNIGRFISEDPIGFGGGINLYAYVGNSPVTIIDPSGLLGLDPATAQQLANLKSLFPDSTLNSDGAGHPYIVVVLPCAEVQKILEQNGYATANNWPDPHGWLFGHEHDHPTGTQARQKPGPNPSLNLHLIVNDSTEKCPFKTCTINGIHNDPHNPLNHPIEHALWDLIPYRLGW